MLKKAVFVGIALVCLTCVGLLYFYIFYIRAPKASYPITVSIEPGQTVSSIADELKAAKLVPSESFLQRLLLSKKVDKRIQAGQYVFEYPMTVFGVSEKIATGDFGYIPVKLTVPEGVNSRRLAEIVHAKFPHIATSTFEVLAKEKEGYLFPETYFFPPNISAENIIQRMSDMFSVQTKPLQNRIQSSGRTLHEVVTIASILEEEVRTKEDMAMVADILERRIAVGMPLQVDATIAYYTGKTSAEMTIKDLRTDNPYNSYTRKGLPPGPISNPGIQAIQSALEPTKNQYFFYLSDKDGITRFSKTHDEHVRLKTIYLR